MGPACSPRGEAGQQAGNENKNSTFALHITHY